jgi:hypothetical protein
MSSTTRPASARRPSPIARLSQAFRQSWARSREIDRQLLAMRYNLDRHSGSNGSGL